MGKSREIARLPNAPAFSAFASTNQSISSGVFTKVNLGTEDYDTNSNFASSRFTPTVAGYYRISAAIDVSNGVSGLSRVILSIYKNGSTYKRLQDHASSTIYTASGSCEVYLNGSTDYVEAFAYVVASSPTLSSGGEYTWMQGSLSRPA